MSSSKSQKQGDPEICEFILKELRQNQAELYLNTNSGCFSPKKIKFAKIFYKKKNPNHILLFFVKGHCHGKIANTSFHISENQLLYLQPGVSHEFHAPSVLGPPIVYIFWFSFPKNPKNIKKPSFVFIPKASHLLPALKELHREHRVEKPGRDEGIRGLLMFVFRSCLRSLMEKETHVQLLSEARCRQLEYFMRSHPTKHPTPRELADYARLSLKYYTRIFRNTYGMPPGKWIMKERISQAVIKLQQTDLNIAEIAHQLGYKDPFLFSRHFKKIMGENPKKFRRSASEASPFFNRISRRTTKR